MPAPLLHIDGLIHRRWRGLLSILDLAQDRLLLAAPRTRTFVKELWRDATIEFVQVHGFNASFQTVVADPQLFDGLGARSLLGPIRLPQPSPPAIGGSPRGSPDLPGRRRTRW